MKFNDYRNYSNDLSKRKTLCKNINIFCDLIFGLGFQFVTCKRP